MIIDCAFCVKENLNTVLAENEQVFAIKDEYPVSGGHALVITQRYTQNYFNNVILPDAKLSDVFN